MDRELIDLVRRLQADRNDVEAQRELYESYWSRLVGFCRNRLNNPADAEDCAQDVFRDILSSIGELPEPQYFERWMFKIANEEVVRYNASERWHIPLPLDSDEEFPKEGHILTTPYPSAGAHDAVHHFMVKASGAAADNGRLPLAEIARIAGSLQATLERLAISISGSGMGPGRRPRDIVDAVRLDFVGFSVGSAILQIERSEPSELLDRSLQTLRQGIAELRTSEGVLPAHFTSQVLTGLRSLAAGVGPAGLYSVEFFADDQLICSFDEDVRDRLRRLNSATREEETTIVGRLHMGDLSPASLRCRIDTLSGSVLCDFDAGLRDAILDDMDQLVMASGIAEVQPDRTTIRLLHIEAISVIRESRSKALTTLAREQGIRAVDDVDDLRGEPVEDFEEFLAAIESARHAE
jgi:RNA polymerase sigma factor (sigma-70 family)